MDTSADRVTLRLREAAAGVEALRKLPVWAQGGQAQGHLIPLGEIATVRRGTVDPPTSAIRHDGHPALALAISMADGGNVLDLGKRVAARIHEIEPQLPLGVHLARINDQSQVVGKDVGEFQGSFLASARHRAVGRQLPVAGLAHRDRGGDQRAARARRRARGHAAARH